MWKTVLFLLFTLILVPLATFYYDVPPTDLQWHIMDSTYSLCLAFALLCFIVSTITNNYSQVDKLWSILPIPYAWMTYMEAPDLRILIMAILITVWGIRLTYNFGRRGGYRWKFWQGDEDYRWAILRAKPEFQPKWKWVAFNFFFICLYQMSLIWMMTTPIIKSVEAKPLHIWDYLIIALAIFFLVIETIADQQQYEYQEQKYAQIKNATRLSPKYQLGFTHTGLWAYSRHPNYLGEQGFWISIYLFSVAATGNWINWSIAGCLLLVLLFKGSSDFSEEISSGKYPKYSDYQKKVGRFIPTRFRPYQPE